MIISNRVLRRCLQCIGWKKAAKSVNTSELIEGKYISKRKFAIAYIKLKDGIEDESMSDEIQRMENRICQIVKGRKRNTNQ